MGYKRPDGSAGIRNHVLVLPTCSCASEVCRIVAEQIDGAVNVVISEGCGEVEGNVEITQRVLRGFALNPNVYGTILIGLGCELVSHHQLEADIRSKATKPIVSFGIQEEGGTRKTIEKAKAACEKMVAEAAKVQRTPCDISNLIIGIECGGSDATSGLASNPVVGHLSDYIVGLGASSVMSETAEFVGAEHILAKRGATPEIKKQIIQICKDLEDHLAGVGQDLRSGQPSPGNKKGGLSTIEEKSLGCIVKGGYAPVVEVVDYAEIPTKKGAIIMDTPGYDISSVTAEIAGGCQIVLFTTGRGTPTGHALVPVYKITGNHQTYLNMEDDMDFDASAVMLGTHSIEQISAELFADVMLIVNGKQSKAEKYGYSHTAMNRICKYI